MNSHAPLSYSVAVAEAITPTEGAAASTDINGATIDLQGYQADSIMAIVEFGAITTGAVTSIHFQQSSASNFSSPDTLAGSITVADDDDGKTFVIDMKRPQKRYVRVLVDRGTQNAVVSSAHYLIYGGRKLPVTHSAVMAVKQLVDPVPAGG